MEVSRQEREFQITVWADSPDNREALYAPIDALLKYTNFLQLSDGTAARLLYKGEFESDKYSKDYIYRRDSIYTVEYATTMTDAQTQVTEIQLNQSGTIDGTTSITPVTSIIF
jgi:hypothetical protein